VRHSSAPPGWRQLQGGRLDQAHSQVTWESKGGSQRQVGSLGRLAGSEDLAVLGLVQHPATKGPARPEPLSLRTRAVHIRSGHLGPRGEKLGAGHWVIGYLFG
jgi:hypothetical protein